ncbi:tetratricopeptide repeat protein [Microbacterium resistens]|uniref:tetratricopeptide repeat protein n=1 Tax=Microbacterium resistens TaxID=156977 RepID=UPI001C561F89|nr:tetratricopeptide repeat protein [Microbacterium resistens]MBW1639080.1 tetratricopeptide repeat protein [Microbacterium resistens]
MTDGSPAAEGAPDPFGPGEDPSAVRGRIPATARWRPYRDRNNDGARSMQRGDLARGEQLLQEVLAATEDPGYDGRGIDGEARDLRARAILNLAAVREWQGRLAEALALTDEGIATAEAALAEIGDERATRTVQLNGRLSRVQVLHALDRNDEALAALDVTAAEIEAAGEELDQRELLTLSTHNIRTGILIIVGRLAEAEAEAHRTIEAAMAFEPSLAAHAYTNLGVIAQRTGDPRAEEYLRMAAQMQGEQGDAATRQLAVENLARSALQDGRVEQAQELFSEAADLAREAGLVTRLAASRTGLASVLLQTRRTAQGLKILRGLIEELTALGSVHELREAYGFLGDAQSALLKHAEAQESYLAARGLARAVHERCRVDLRRAEAYAEWASVTPLPGRRMQRLRTALEIAVPVLLATEALREDFPPGPVRERWGLAVTAPARELAFRLAGVLREAELMFDLVENAAASATLQSEAVPTGTTETPGIAPLFDPFRRDDLIPSDPAAERADPDAALLPAAASGLWGGSGSASVPRFALPPRVRRAPGTGAALDEWIVRAEAEYGVRVRADTVVAAW